MALSIKNYPCSALNPRKNLFSSESSTRPSSVGLWNYNFRYRNPLQACFFSPIDEPILKEALKEPVAFVGGMFAGLLRLDLEEDPLKEWVTRTVEASGITEEEMDAEATKPDEESPEQIEIE
ncbi:hypothetical protein LWI28_021884 [Acer negundo]|uniref:Uncharacterized protein n=1 Tax=Acer negundo TaxID=4023 RepID=A0AAD5NPW2_ACENE|nr:hypothetical protein LWI28_021884 [Acer negundo]KAK4843305.1 hypothetical protein QYF36_006570 [Acer negundo]